MEQAQEFMNMPKVLDKDDFYINEEVWSDNDNAIILLTFYLDWLLLRLYSRLWQETDKVPT